MTRPGEVQRRKAALWVLTNASPLSRKAGSFLGTIVADPVPLSSRQMKFFAELQAEAGFDFAKISSSKRMKGK